ncbi:MAG: hypothetical protein ABJ275_08530 [Maricaulaceae bacterium]
MSLRGVKVCISVVVGSLVFTSTASAQNRTIENPSFEDGPMPSSFSIHSDTLHPGWFSTNGEMETWADGFQSRNAQEGNYLVELNPSAPVGLYQEICLVQNEILSWDFYHSARGEIGGTDQTLVYEVISQDGATTHQTLSTNTLSPMGVGSNNQTNNLWDNVADSAVYTGPTGTQRLQFRSTNSGSNGNFLDDINIELIPIVTFENLNTSALETATTGLPQFVINGEVPTAFEIQFSITGGTATLGTDYTVSSNSISIPVGSYDGASATSTFPVPITILPDNVFESDETIEITYNEVTPSTAAVLSGPNCSTPSTAAIHTIMDATVATVELTVTKTTGATGTLQADGSFSQAFTIELENTGNVAINNPTLSDDLEAIFGAAFEPSTEAVTTGGVTIAPTVTANSGNTGTAPSSNSAYDGDGSDGLLDGTSGTLDAGDKIAINFTAMFRAHVMSGDVTNSVTANGTAPSGSTLTPDMATSLVPKPALPSPRPTLTPTACGAHLAEGFLTNPLPTEPDVVFGDGTTNDPYVQQYMTRNATTGEVSIYYSSSDVILNGSDIHSDMTSELVTDRPGAAGQQSELWRLAIRLDGTPGDSINVPIRTENVHEFTTWWLTDTSGAFLGNNDWLYTTRTSNPGGDGENFDVSITFPSDGIVYLNIVMSDPVNRRGSFTISASDYTCPAASAVLDAAKTVAMFEPTAQPAYAIPGNDVIYTITVNNTGDGPTDTDSIELIDNMPSSISFWNGDIDFGGPDNFTNTTPVAIDQSSGTGLTFDYTTDVRFGFGASAPDDFDDCSALTPDATYRDDVKFICLNPKGALSAGSPTPNFSLSFRARIN